MSHELKGMRCPPYLRYPWSSVSHMLVDIGKALSFLLGIN